MVNSSVPLGTHLMNSPRLQNKLMVGQRKLHRLHKLPELHPFELAAAIRPRQRLCPIRQPPPPLASPQSPKDRAEGFERQAFAQTPDELGEAESVQP